MIIAFTYNVRHIYPDPNDLKSHKEADFDDPVTITSMIKHLKSTAYKIFPI